MIKFQKVSKKFGIGSAALSDINLQIDKEEFTFLVGPTGSGKTTLFRLIIGEILPTEGDVVVADWSVKRLPKDKVPQLRKKVGVVFQDLKLLADRTVLENVLLPLEIDGKDEVLAKKRASEVLEQVGLAEHKDKFPSQLSGGELQRVAIARAMSLSPQILLADEPTGNLDPATAFDIVNKLLEINKKGTTVVMATHNFDIVKNIHKRVIALDKGRIVKDERSNRKKT